MKTYNNISENFRFARIPKGVGAFRTICIPSPTFAKRLRACLPQLEAILAEADSTHSNYAFQRGKNCALMALQHVGYRYTLSLDLEGFFDSVTPRHVTNIIPPSLVEMCFVDGNPKQGLPTSPLIATIAFLPCDVQILWSLRSLGIEAVYTRYADDLVFSFNNRRDVGKIKVLVEQIVQKNSFQLNRWKNRLQDLANGRIVVTGISVDSKGIHPTRKTMKKMRAALHQGNISCLAGLTEWSKCKLPLVLFTGVEGKR